MSSESSNVGVDSASSGGVLSRFGGSTGLFGGFVDETNGYFGYTPMFYAIWIPAAFLALATALSPKGVAKKLYFWGRGVSFFWLSNEKKGLSKAPDSAALTEVAPTRKTVVFVRHGESDWNEIFNKSKLLLLPRLVWGIAREIMFLPTSHSIFIDSPLSKTGIKQAMTLRSFLSSYAKQTEDRTEELDTLVATMNGEADGMPSVMVASNLRRAINTGCVSFWHRLRRSNEKIILLDSLQEMSRNVDTNALAGENEFPEMSVVEKALGSSFSAAGTLDPSQNHGNKAMFSTALPRLEAFNNWVFGREEPCIIVAGGHSLWFMNYFRTFLPKSSSHRSKTDKLLNCGAVSFELEVGRTADGKTWHRVDESTITVIHGGFKTKGKKKKGKKDKKAK